MTKIAAVSVAVALLLAAASAQTPTPTATPTATATATATETEMGGTAEATPSGSVTATPTESPVCFAATSRVTLADGSSRTMDRVRVGDVVVSARADGTPTTSEVFLVQHAGVSRSVPMVTLTTGAAAAITVTKDHYIAVPAAGAAEAYRKAGEIGVGDAILTAAGAAVVERVDAAVAPPRNIHTMNDRVVVDGIVASCVSSLKVLGMDTMQIRAMLAPLKVMYRLGLGDAVRVIDGGVDAAYVFGVEKIVASVAVMAATVAAGRRVVKA